MGDSGSKFAHSSPALCYQRLSQEEVQELLSSFGLNELSPAKARISLHSFLRLFPPVLHPTATVLLPVLRDVVRMQQLQARGFSSSSVLLTGKANSTDAGGGTAGGGGKSGSGSRMAGGLKSLAPSVVACSSKGAARKADETNSGGTHITLQEIVDAVSACAYGDREELQLHMLQRLLSRVSKLLGEQNKRLRHQQSIAGGNSRNADRSSICHSHGLFASLHNQTHGHSSSSSSSSSQQPSEAGGGGSTAASPSSPQSVALSTGGGGGTALSPCCPVNGIEAVLYQICVSAYLLFLAIISPSNPLFSCEDPFFLDPSSHPLPTTSTISSSSTTTTAQTAPPSSSSSGGGGVGTYRDPTQERRFSPPSSSIHPTSSLSPPPFSPPTSSSPPPSCGSSSSLHPQQHPFSTPASTSSPSLPQYTTTSRLERGHPHSSVPTATALSSPLSRESPSFHAAGGGDPHHTHHHRGGDTSANNSSSMHPHHYPHHHTSAQPPSSSSSSLAYQHYRHNPYNHNPVAGAPPPPNVTSHHHHMSNWDAASSSSLVSFPTSTPLNFSFLINAFSTSTVHQPSNTKGNHAPEVYPSSPPVPPAPSNLYHQSSHQPNSHSSHTSGGGGGGGGLFPSCSSSHQQGVSNTSPSSPSPAQSTQQQPATGSAGGCSSGYRGGGGVGGVLNQHHQGGTGTCISNTPMITPSGVSKSQQQEALLWLLQVVPQLPALFVIAVSHFLLGVDDAAGENNANSGGLAAAGGGGSFQQAPTLEYQVYAQRRRRSGGSGFHSPRRGSRLRGGSQQSDRQTFYHRSGSLEALSQATCGWRGDGPLDGSSKIFTDETAVMLRLSSTLFAFPPTYPWRRLYASWKQGASFNRICSSVFYYDAPTVLLIKTKRNGVLGALISVAWRDGGHLFFGDSNCFLFSLEPQFQIIRPSGLGRNFVYINVKNQFYPKGIGFGGQAGCFRLWLGDDFQGCYCTRSDATYGAGILHRPAPPPPPPPSSSSILAQNNTSSRDSLGQSSSSSSSSSPQKFTPGGISAAPPGSQHSSRTSTAGYGNHLASAAGGGREEKYERHNPEEGEGKREEEEEGDRDNSSDGRDKAHSNSHDESSSHSNGQGQQSQQQQQNGGAAGSGGGTCSYGVELEEEKDVFHLPFEVREVEVWGCGDASTRQQQLAAKNREEQLRMERRQVDRGRFAQNDFDREFLLENTFNRAKGADAPTT